MLCPLDVLGHLVALQGDRVPEIRSISLHLLQCEDEKYSSFLDNRVVEGVELSYFLQHSSNNGDEVQAVISGVDETGSPCFISVFSGLYASCLQKNRKRRSDFIVGLLRRYEYLHSTFMKDAASSDEKQKSLSPSPIRVRGKQRDDISSRMHVIDFILTSLAYLPYDMIDEPLLAIHWINKIVSVSTAVLLGEMKKALHLVGAVEREEGAMQAPAEG
jgi:hypothetical protein